MEMSFIGDLRKLRFLLPSGGAIVCRAGVGAPDAWGAHVGAAHDVSPGGDRRALLQPAHATGDAGEDEVTELDRVNHGTVPQAVDLRHGLLPRVRWSSLSYNT